MSSSNNIETNTFYCVTPVDEEFEVWQVNDLFLTENLQMYKGMSTVTGQSAQ